MKATSASPFPWARCDLIIAGGIGVVFLILYLRTVAPSLLTEGDGIELAMVAGGGYGNITQRAGYATVWNR